ncbi:MAG: penicillin-binding transpeptidase domain-containing protein, partial [Bacillota bacterium]
DKYRGYVNLRTALTHSINVASVKLLQDIGVKETVKTAEEMGISTFTSSDGNKEHLSLALGGLTDGVKPIEISSAYGIFANKGIKTEPYAIKTVIDKDGKKIYEAQVEKDIIFSEETSFIMTDMLRSVVEDGTGRRANLNDSIAGKTGTTNDYTDAWFVGYTPNLVTTVWIGEDNPKEMVYDEKDSNGNYIYSEGNNPRTISSSEAAMLWKDYMSEVLKDKEVKNYEVPDGIHKREIDPVTGQLANQYTPNPSNEIFRKENIPEETDSLHGPIEKVKIDVESGMLATSNCPQKNIKEYSYIKDSGIRVGPENIPFKELIDESSENNEEIDEEEIIKGTYIVDEGEPIQKIDPETGIPLKDKNGQIIYENKPTRTCTIHNEEEGSFMDYFQNMFGD